MMQYLFLVGFNEWNEEDGQMEVQVIRDRPAEGERQRPKCECPMPDCDKVLENIPRHLRQFHKMTAVEAANQVSLQGYLRTGRLTTKLSCAAPRTRDWISI
ncbi:uncharacterized protein LOC117321084 [Pecten maximus]|uniref:uncharacterized protein LOC117321083 n=1 Tax=Pecten maximus TaxID=6579 RepID=UPI001458490B|nr:uncharacterized protein LOC117321083 [Pecten maximus]XP_033731459.1 uncharacterized protein LOC117321084 [Pecten maximus]